MFYLFHGWSLAMGRAPALGCLEGLLCSSPMAGVVIITTLQRFVIQSQLQPLYSCNCIALDSSGHRFPFEWAESPYITSIAGPEPGNWRDLVLLGGQERQVPLDGSCRRMRFLVEWILAPGDLIRVAINQSIPQALVFCWCEICQWPSGETRATFITSSQSGWRQRKEVWAQTALFLVFVFFGGVGIVGHRDRETF